MFAFPWNERFRNERFSGFNNGLPLISRKLVACLGQQVICATKPCELNNGWFLCVISQSVAQTDLTICKNTEFCLYFYSYAVVPLVTAESNI